MDRLFVPLASLFGASVDQVKLITYLLVSYPLGTLFIHIPSNRPELRHLFSTAITLLLFFPVLRLYGAFFQLLGGSLATYYLAQYVHGPKKKCPGLSSRLVAMGHLIVNHVIRDIYKYGPYETLEITGPQMVLTMKLTTFAWNVYDARQPLADLDKWQTAKRITDFPTLLEFVGYSFYFPGIIVGPYLDYAEYMDLINETKFKNLVLKGKGGRNVPSGRKRAAYRKMLAGLVYLGVFVGFSSSWNYSISLTPWFVQQSLLFRIAVYQLCGVVERTKYYAIWTLTEGASILTGLGFTGISASGDTLWTGAANVDVLNIEFPSNFKIFFDSWNMKANVWLRECVYKRVTPKGKKPGFRSSMITFMTSAFWHGIASSYYLSFLTAGFITTIARLARKNIRPILLPAPGSPPSLAKRAYDVLGTIVTVLLINYASAPHMLLDVEASFATWARLGFYGHIIIGGGLAFFYSGGTKFFRRVQAKHAAAAAAAGGMTPVQEKQFMVPPTLDQIVPPPGDR
ncbi:endoplasmic reticulum protein [Mycena pura]|uniref:Endoplasmic reticulum protein n=1 Tax=Mycena pura TaxID=153505 RepID=A0AAD6YTN0_9AGAR|nr:endoplasmic reticulum protein [Mycena pura]